MGVAMGAALMSEKEKAGENPGRKKQNPGVKLHPKFHQRLKMVADDLGFELGELIQREMEEFVTRESKRIAGDILADSPPE
jgi:hypothetical protein